MNSRERILAVIEHKPVDKVPTDIWATEEIWKGLEEHFGTQSRRLIKDRMGIDGIESIGVDYTGNDRKDKGDLKAGIWGSYYREIILPAGGVYLEQEVYPLKNVNDIAALKDFNWEDPLAFDYSKSAEELKKIYKEHAVMCGYMAPFYDLWILFGVETALLNLALYPDFMCAVLEKVMDYRLKQHKKLFEEYKGCMDICQVTDDFGQQSGLVMSIDMIREFFWPHYKKAIGLAKEYNLKIFHHDDGGMAEIIPDLIELGVNILNPIQWKCEGMSLELLKKRFGSKICFHGTVENQDILPFGTALEVRKETRKNIDILFKDRTGLIIGPCHSIQSGTPIENVLALFDEAQRYKI